MKQETKQQILEFFGKFGLGVISTVTPENKSESAFVGYSLSDNLELLVGTSNLSRKYQNLQTNKSISFVIADFTGEIQYEGEASQLSFADYDRLITDKTFGALPGIEKYRGDPNQVFFKISPSWLRFIQHGENDQIEEFTEFA